MEDIRRRNACIPESIDEYVHDLISRRAQNQPSAPAISISTGRTLSYRDLEALSNRLAQQLSRMILPGAIIPLCFEKSMWTPVAMVAVLKAGGAFTLLDVSQPEDRLKSIVKQTRADVVCCSSASHDLGKRLLSVGELKSHDIDAGDVDVDVFILAPSSQKPQNSIETSPHTTPHCPCYVVFTSGSTGTPKGAVLSHSSICSAFQYQLDHLGLTSKSRVFDFASHAFDVAVHNMLATLVVGGCLCVPTENERLQDPAGAMTAMQVTFANLTPSVARLIAPHQTPTLQTLVFLGETLTQAEAQRWTASANHIRIVNTYGPAECTPISTINTPMDFQETTKNMGIGVGMGVLCWVVDAENSDFLLSPGDVGELLLEGPLIGMGYLFDPEKTANAFISSPRWLRSIRPSSRLYRTGDLVQQNEDGSFLFMGRKDTQVKINGQRVELGEIEYHVQACFPGAVQIVVDTISSPTGLTLAAFVQVNGGTAHDPEQVNEMRISHPTPEVNQHISRRLPGYMIPNIYLLVTSIPRTASGKTDRNSLKNRATEVLASNYTNSTTNSESQPTSELERKIQFLCGTVLEISPEKLGLDDPFLAIGGDSLSAIRLVGEARKEGVQLRAADVLSPQFTLRGLAHSATAANDQCTTTPFSWIDDYSPTDLNDIASSCRVDAAAIEDVYPCTTLQEGLIALAMQSPGDYILQLTLSLNGFNKEAMREAWNKVYNETSILRTRICQGKSGPVQVVVKAETGSVQWSNGHDLHQYLEKDKLDLMELGSPLARFAVVKDKDELAKEERIVITLHHALYDAWSLDLILKRAEQFYLGESSLPQAASFKTHFNSFLSYVEERRNDPLAKGYWRDAFGGAEFVQFPPLQKTEHESHQPSERMQYHYQPAQNITRTSEATLSTLIRGALAILLSHHTGSKDVVFGCTVSGRSAPVTGIEEIIGPTITTVPIRVQLSDREKITINDLLRILQTQASEMIPFEQTGLQQIAKLGEGPRQACGFQTLLVVQPEPKLGDENHMLWQFETEQLSTYALTVECFPCLDGSIKFQARYNPSVLNSWHLTAMLEQFGWIIGQLADTQKASLPLEDVNVIPSHQRDVIQSWNATIPTGVDRFVHDVIREKATQKHVDRPAICAWDGDLSYSELDRHAGRLATHLLGLGIENGTLVPICFEKSVFSVIAILAILKVGAGFVPIEPGLPPDRLRAILEETAARLVVTSQQHATLFGRSFNTQTIQLSWKFLNNLPSEDEGHVYASRAKDLSPLQSVAYVIFTSGTTGRPKGVVIEHGAASSSCIAHGMALGFDENTRTLQFSSYAFDACIVEIFTTLMFGGCICIPSDSDRQSRLTEFINSVAVNWTFLTPTVAELIDPSAVPCLRTIALGGEKVSPIDAERWKSDGRRVFVAYGPTECCVFCSTHDLAEDADSSFIGLPSGCVAWVVDPTDHQRLAPLGSFGELLIEGPILARGYLNDLEKSNSSFISDPIWLEETGRQGRVYKTGDLVQYAPKSMDGGARLRYMGRKDTQVKIRGQRLELAEVEYHVRKCVPCAKRAISEVVSPDDVQSSQILVAFVEIQSQVSSSSTILDGARVSDHDLSPILSLSPDVTQEIARGLPDYMIPALYIAVSGPLPQMVSSSKIDRRRLREMGGALVNQHRAAMEASADKKRTPSSEIERKLQSIWSRVLNIPNVKIGLDDNFFHLGGDSITAMRLVSESRKHSLALTVADVVRMPILAVQARSQEQEKGSESLPTTNEIESFSLLPEGANATSVCADLDLPSEEVEDIYPCSPLQEGIFALASKRPGDYILHNILELAGDIRIDAFKAAWEETVRLTPILRTKLMSHSELGLLQIVQHGKPDWFSQENCSVESYLENTKPAPMGLGQPLSRFALLGPSNQPHYFVWSVHHVLYDGWSLPLITEMATRFYSNDLPIRDQQPFKAFVRYVQQHKCSAADTFWRQNLDGHDSSPFPALPPHIREPMADSKHEQEVSFPSTKSSDVSISTILRAALALVIGRHSDSSDVVFGAIVSGRSAPVPGVTSIIGPTISTVPIRMSFQAEEGPRTIYTWLQALQKQATDMIPFEQTGLQNIARLSPDAHRGCQFQTLLVIQSENEAMASSQSCAFGTWQGADEQSEFATYALTLEYVPTAGSSGNGISRARFDSRVINAWTVQRILGQWEHVTRQLIAAIVQESSSGMGSSLVDIDILPSQDHAILQSWNITSPAPVAVNRCVHVMITEQCRTRQAEMAIDGWDAQLTFAELETLTDRLAEYLIGLGIGSEVLVPLCFPKSSWTIVAMLGVLKAGGAFVLLDPTHPRERLRMLCKKSQATVAIASSSLTREMIQSFVDVVLIVDKQIAEPGWRPSTAYSGSPQGSPLPSNASSSSSSMQLVSPNNTAYVIFTSGSTGAPKGCKIEHRSYCSAAVYHGSSLQMSSNTRALQFGSYSFAGAIMEILMTLIHGGCICIPREEERNPSLLAHAIQRLNANWAFLTSSVLGALHPEMVPSLRTICVGGEAVQASQIGLWSNKVHLRQTYGSAETSAVVSSAHLTEGATTGDVGKPTTGRYWIVDPVDVDRLAPLGAVGEVIIESSTIGREYLDEPKKTAAAFIQAPAWRERLFGETKPGLRFYKTGDFGSFAEEGAIRLRGRRDAQVKLRGQRIELGEIEHQARTASDLLSEVAVEVAVPKNSDGKANAAMLVAFFVLREQDQRVNSNTEVMKVVQRQLQRVLPQYMVPAAFMALLEMPKTISKKTDRRQLREIISSRQRDELLRLSVTNYDIAPKRAPTTDRERVLLSVWTHVLGVDQMEIGVDDDFFQLGGDSVMALKLVAESRRAGLVLSMSDVFTHRVLSSLAHVAADPSPVVTPSIEKFSLILDGGHSLDELRDELATSCGVNNVQIEDAYPCTPLQEGLLSLTLKNPGDYILQNILELSEDVILEDLQAAWQQTVSAISTLRTRIVQHPRLGPLQVVVNGNIEWKRVSGFGMSDSFLDQDKIGPIDFGLPLSRFAIMDGETEDQPRRLVWTIHHALYDGWSLPIVFDMVSQAYSSGLPPSRCDFVPFVKYLLEGKPEETNTYWQSTLESYDSVAFPPLPTPTHRPMADKTIQRDISLQEMRQRPGITLSNLLRATLGILISRQTNTDDVLFGAVLSGRNAPVPDIEAIIGSTTATVPVRMQFPVAQTVDEYLHVIQTQSVDMIPFEQTGLQHIGRMKSSASDFQTLLVIHPANEKLDDSSRNDVFGTWATNAEQSGFSTYALTLEIFLPASERSDIRLKAVHDSAVISDWEMSQFLDRFPVVLQQLIEINAKCLVSEVDVLPPRDCALVWKYNQAVPELIDRCVHELVRERTALQPDAIALSAWDGEMTYQELELLSDRLAQRLITAHGFQSGLIVPLCFEKSIWTVVAMLACMKSGLTAVTMDITQPPERLRTIVQQIGDPPLILASVEGEKLASQLLFDRPIFVVGSQSVHSLREHPQQLPCIAPSTPVCVVFTSGSSGLPKGAALTHANFSTGIHHQAKKFGHGPGARIFAFASYSFDISWFDTLHALASGSTLYIPSEAQRKNDLEGSLARSGATVAFMTPSVARLLRPNAVPDLRLLALGGEPQRWADFRDWPDHVTKLSVYGPAECTVVSAAEDARTNLQPRDFTLPSSEGMGLNSWLVDPANPSLLAPLGATGEIWLEGPLVGAGYIGDEPKTAAAFVEDPPWLLKGGGAAHLPGRRGRLYKTGDMARYNRDGHLCFMGRKDTQVKIRGQRVELAEIEHHVRQVMGDRNEKASQVVAEIITLANDGDGGDSVPTLVAFVEQERSIHDHEDDLGATLMPARSKLINELLLHLPNYMVPMLYFSISSVPRTVNGKTDRKKLRHIGSEFSRQQLTEQMSTSNEAKPPSTVIESCLQRLWAQVLRLSPDRISVHDNFFQIGGDSIAAMRLVGLARNEGITLTVAEIFRFPTLHEQAEMHPLETEFLCQDHTVAPFSLFPGINRSAICEELARSFGITDPVEDLYPCTPLQEGLFALTSKHAGDYVMQSVMELPESTTFNISAFKAAWEEVVGVTDVLRTRIVEHDHLGLAQLVTRQDSIKWMHIQETVECYLSRDKLAPMEFGMPLTRFALIGSHGSGGPRWFVWTAHHALYDGWSLSMITERAAIVYQRLINASPKAHHLPTVKFNSFVQYVELQKISGQHKHFWEKTLARTYYEGTAFPSLPASVSQPMANRSVDQYCSFNTSTHRTSTTTSALTRAALAIVLSQYTGEPEAIYGATVSGRNAPVCDIEHIVGPTIATVPLRIAVSGECRVGDFLASVQQQATDMIPYEQTGLQHISKISEDARQACNFQTLLVVQPSEFSSDERQYENYGTWQTDANQQGFTTYALTIECTSMQDGTGLAFRATFDDRVVEQWIIERLLNQLSFVVHQLTAVPPDHILSEIDVLPPHDKEMIWKWNASLPESVDRCVHDIIFDVAHDQPEAQAILAWDGNLTYGQLNDIADSLAGTLLSNGVITGMIVPLCFEKSKWTAVAVLGVLKAGAAFVFLDAETQPEARIRAIVEQTKTKIVCSSIKHQALSQSLAPATVVVGPGLLHRSPSSLPRVDPASPLYLNFTSGSTGHPKGAIVPHRSFSSALHHQLAPLNFTPNTRLYDFASYSFDVSIHNMLATLSAGGCLCVPSDMDRKTRLAESMEEMQANYIDLTASVSRLLDPREVPTLGTLTFGGEPVSQDDTERWWGKVRLINSCGPSECTPMSVINSSPDSPTALRRIGLGTGMVTWIVHPEDHHRLLPVGQVGELVLEGPLLGSGYLGDTARTAATFIEPPRWLSDRRPHPSKVYKTGDLVRYHPDGSLQILGRKDTQVKVRGQRVELEEVEQHLRRLVPNNAKVVAEAVAMKPSTTLVAFICVHAETTEQAPQVDESGKSAMAIMADKLVEQAARVLPPYMVPSLYVPLISMPMSATGKTNRKGLRSLASAFSRDQVEQMRGLPSNRKPIRAPETKLQRQLQHLWARILQLPVETIDLEKSFFALGGDSITAMHLVGEARKEGLQFSVADIFRERTILNLIRNNLINLEHIERRSPSLIPYSLVNPAVKEEILSRFSDPTSICDILPTTDFQAESVVQPCNYFYLDLGTASINQESLRNSCQAILAHFPLLRSKFVHFEDRCYQVVLQRPPISFATIQSENRLDLASDAACAEDSRDGIPPSEFFTKFILVRGTETSERTMISRLIIRLSHAQYDAFSLSAMLHKLADNYDCQQAVPAPSANSSFGSYLAQLIQQRPRSRSYWTKKLTGSCNTPILSALSRHLKSITHDEPRPARKINAERTISLPHLPEDVPKSTLLGSAWAVVLSVIIHSDDVIFGHLVASRDRFLAGDSGNEIAGPCVNIIPVRVKSLSSKLKTTSGIRDLPRSMLGELLSLPETGVMMGYQDIIRSCTEWGNQANGPHPILESVVQHQNINENPEIEVAGVHAKLHWYENPDVMPPVPLGLASYPVGEGLRIRILSSDQYITEGIASCLVAYLCEIIGFLARQGVDGDAEVPRLHELCTRVSADLG